MFLNVYTFFTNTSSDMFIYEEQIEDKFWTLNMILLQTQWE